MLNRRKILLDNECICDVENMMGGAKDSLLLPFLMHPLSDNRSMTVFVFLV